MAKTERRKIAWVLGAGFSKSLGGPLLYDMLTSKTLAQIPDKFSQPDFVNLYANYENHRRPEGGAVYWRHAEEFFDFVDTARKAGPRQKIIKALFPGVDPQTVYGRCVQAIVAETSFATDGDLESEAWQPYLRWAQSLTRDDSIITFNYDLVLEHLGTHQSVGFLGRKSVFGPSQDAEVYAPIYKLHGSIDWLITATGQPIQLSPQPEQTIQSPARILLASPGPTKKLHRETHLKPIWDKAELALKDADAIVFCGYRFPPSDPEALRILLQAIFDNDRPDLRIHILLGPDASSVPACQRLVSLLTLKLSSKRGMVRRGPHDQREKHCEIVVHPLGVEDFFAVMNRAEIYEEAYPPYKK